MDNTQQLLQVSAKLYQHLSNLPSEDERDDYIVKINSLLDERGEIIEHLINNNFFYDVNNKSHLMLSELDKGIRERLEKIMDSIKIDLKDLQNAKKNEKQYLNPYSSVSIMDGRYYDQKK